jgi:hypothetical protein
MFEARAARAGTGAGVGSAALGCSSGSELFVVVKPSGIKRLSKLTMELSPRNIRMIGLPPVLLAEEDEEGAGAGLKEFVATVPPVGCATAGSAAAAANALALFFMLEMGKWGDGEMDLGGVQTFRSN